MSSYRVFVRKELPGDQLAVSQLLREAFIKETHGEPEEQFLVDRLRNSAHFIPGLSLVAELNEKVVGYLLLTRASILGREKKHTILALAPVAVLPEYQHRGIGSQLIRNAHQKAAALGFNSIAVIGHKDYYPKFGYCLADDFGIRFPFKAPEINRFVIELKPGSLTGVSGDLEYAREFFEEY